MKFANVRHSLNWLIPFGLLFDADAMEGERWRGLLLRPPRQHLSAYIWKDHSIGGHIVEALQSQPFLDSEKNM